MDDEPIGWLAPAAMHSYDALLLFFEELRVGGILEDMQLVSIEPTTTPGYPRGHILTFYNRVSATHHTFNTAEYVNPQRIETVDETPMTYDEAVAILRRLMAQAVTWGYSHGTKIT